jgi:cytochrome c
MILRPLVVLAFAFALSAIECSSTASDSAALGGGPSGGASPSDTRRLLLMSKTAGFRHESIADGIHAVQELGAQHDWEVVATEDGAMFNEATLSRFDAVLFLNTTGDILDAPAEAALENFVTSGGGFVGVHAATDTEPDWTWYRELLGAHFASHPAIQEASVHVEDPSHPATVELPDPWLRVDEWYNFDQNPRGVARVLLSLEESSYEGGTMGADHPIAWTRELGESRVFYSALGHTAESYTEPAFLAHLAGGIAWVLGTE